MTTRLVRRDATYDGDPTNPPVARTAYRNTVTGELEEYPYECHACLRDIDDEYDECPDGGIHATCCHECMWDDGRVTR